MHEIMLVSGYQPSSGTTVVDIDRPGKKVLLVLTSYSKVNWQVNASPSTAIAGIVVSGYEQPTLTTSLLSPGYLVTLPSAYEADNVKFKELLGKLNTWFGATKVDSFQGSYSIPERVRVSSIDTPGAELTLDGPLPVKLNRNVSFSLLTNGYENVRLSLAGPAQGAAKSYRGEGKIAVSKSGNAIYSLTHKGLEVAEPQGRTPTLLPLPPGFPAFSWAADVAYDTKRDIVSVVSDGGEGFFYRYDAKARKWLDFLSLKNVDIASLAYDAAMDRYVAWTSAGRLQFFTTEGYALNSRELVSRLAGFGRLYDRGNGRPPRITIVPNGNDIALVYISDNSVQNIWYYDVKNDSAALTFRNK
ncbi:MAG: hypothetical protein Q7S67_03990 [Telluria sp.]|nr:hypothetical protein [Telluria sp.]